MAVREAGAHALRGGIFKPRTSPYSFQGWARRAWSCWSEARELTGLPIVTEVMREEQIPLLTKYVDVLQIGARNMQNFALLHAVGESQHPVLLKRGMMATVEELLMAAEYILSHGNRRVILCERGIRTFENCHPQHHRHQRHPGAQGADPPAGDPGPQPQHRQLELRVGDRAGGRCRRRGWLDHRSAPTPGRGPVGWRAVAQAERFAELVGQIKRVAEAVGRKVAPVNQPVH